MIFNMNHAEICYCDVCQCGISDRFYLSVGTKKKAHCRCLVCKNCKSSLSAEKSCYEKKNGLFCRACYINLFSQKCNACYKVLSRTDLVMRVRESCYHVNCFQCKICHTLMKKGQKVGISNNDIYCESHYHLSVSNVNVYNNNNSNSNKNIGGSNIVISTEYSYLNNNNNEKNNITSINHNNNNNNNNNYTLIKERKMQDSIFPTSTFQGNNNNNNNNNNRDPNLRLNISNINSMANNDYQKPPSFYSTQQQGFDASPTTNPSNQNPNLLSPGYTQCQQPTFQQNQQFQQQLSQKQQKQQQQQQISCPLQHSLQQVSPQHNPLSTSPQALPINLQTTQDKQQLLGNQQGFQQTKNSLLQKNEIFPNQNQPFPMQNQNHPTQQTITLQQQHQQNHPQRNRQHSLSNLSPIDMDSPPANVKKGPMLSMEQNQECNVHENSCSNEKRHYLNLETPNLYSQVSDNLNTNDGGRKHSILDRKLREPTVPKISSPIGELKEEMGGNSIASSTSSGDDEKPCGESNRSKSRGKKGEKPKRNRTTFKKHQVEKMRKLFEVDKNPDSNKLATLAQEIELSKRVLQVWFQNARAKQRKGTESNEKHLIPELGSDEKGNIEITSTTEDTISFLDDMKMECDDEQPIAVHEISATNPDC